MFKKVHNDDVAQEKKEKLLTFWQLLLNCIRKHNCKTAWKDCDWTHNIYCKKAWSANLKSNENTQTAIHFNCTETVNLMCNHSLKSKFKIHNLNVQSESHRCF